MWQRREISARSGNAHTVNPLATILGMAEWQLRLAGSNAVLEALVSELNEPARAVKRDVRGFYMTSAAFGTDETASPTDVSVGVLMLT
jgi:hypothetical protein